MINGIKKGTIASTTEDRLTLLQWLKKLEKTLSDDTLTDIAFTDDNGNVSLSLTFEDGTAKRVAFPYDMSAFAKKSEMMLEDRGTLDIRDTSKFDIEEIQDNLDAYLKVNLPNGIYHLDTSSFLANKIIIFHFGPKGSDEQLNYKYLRLPKSYAGNPFNATDGYCNGLDNTQCNVRLGQDYKDFEYVIIIDRGTVTFTVVEDI